MDHSLLISMIEINVSMPDRLLKIESCQPVEEIYCQNDIPVGLLMKSRMYPFRKMFMWAPFVYLLSAVKKILPYQGKVICSQASVCPRGGAWQGVCGKGLDWWGTWVQERWSLKQAVPIPLECILVT